MISWASAEVADIDFVMHGYLPNTLWIENIASEIYIAALFISSSVVNFPIPMRMAPSCKDSDSPIA